MNLEQVRNRKFDDVLYMLTDYFKKMSSLPSELCKTDEWFFMRTFEIFNDIEQNNPIMLNQTRDTGLTTALQFIISYYSLHYKNITLLVDAGSYTDKFKIVYDVFTDVLNFNPDCKYMTNSMIFKHKNVEYCSISIRDTITFNNADLVGPVIFDTKKPIKNYSKYDDLMKTNVKNKKKYDRLVFNFPENEDMLKLAKEYKIETKTIKIF